MSVSPQEITEAITEELAEPKYRFEEPWYADLIDWLERAWTRFVEWLVRVSEAVGGPVVAGIIVGAVLVGVVALITINLGRRRARLVEERLRRERQTVRGLDPGDLERQADEAAAQGHDDEAFRFQFQALLIRLDEAGMIDLRPGTTTGLVDDALDSAEFHSVATRFDAVVYGGAPGRPQDRADVIALNRSLVVRS